jgi:hypothetical protein
MGKPRSLPELGGIIQSHAASIHDLFNELNIPQPSLCPSTASGKTVYPEALRKHQGELLEALDELRAVILGPTSYLYWTSILGVRPSTT